MTPDDPTPEQELASAYLDGDVTAVERARVETTPELQALVASMRQVKWFIAAVPVVSDTVRDVAVASALGEFEVAGNVVSLATHRRWPSKVLSAAAAVVLLGVVGVTVLRSSNDDKSETASRDAEPKLDANPSDQAVGAGVPETAGGEVSISLASPIAIDDPQQLLSLTVPSPTVGAPPDADNGSDTTGSSTTGAVADTQRVESFNVEALACMSDDQVFLADIYYQGTLAIAVRDTVTGVTEAIDGNCTVLASVSP